MIHFSPFFCQILQIYLILDLFLPVFFKFSALHAHFLGRRNSKVKIGGWERSRRIWTLFTSGKLVTSEVVDSSFSFSANFFKIIILTRCPISIQQQIELILQSREGKIEKNASRMNLTLLTLKSICLLNMIELHLPACVTLKCSLKSRYLFLFTSQLVQVLSYVALVHCNPILWFWKIFENVL